MAAATIFARDAVGISVAFTTGTTGTTRATGATGVAFATGATARIAVGAALAPPRFAGVGDGTTFALETALGDVMALAVGVGVGVGAAFERTVAVTALLAASA